LRGDRDDLGKVQVVVEETGGASGLSKYSKVDSVFKGIGKREEFALMIT
jgi:hypothetical protein